MITLGLTRNQADILMNALEDYYYVSDDEDVKTLMDSLDEKYKEEYGEFD